MFKFDNTHIFTGYLKQLLASFHLPMCRIYTRDFARHIEATGEEDPRIIESCDKISYQPNAENDLLLNEVPATRISYLKNNKIVEYFWPYDENNVDLGVKKCYWKSNSDIFFEAGKRIAGLTRALNSHGISYDTETHEFLGEYLRFMRDYYNIDLMSLYNCFSNKVYSDISYVHTINNVNINFNNALPVDANNSKTERSKRFFNSRDVNYNIYAFPVKLFQKYTIAIDCIQGIEMFCGFYKTSLDTSGKALDLMSKTYHRENKTIFKQPFIYDKLAIIKDKDSDRCRWCMDEDIGNLKSEATSSKNTITRWDIASREQDLKLFIKIPVTCKSSITVLEGDYRHFNDFKYDTRKEGQLNQGEWEYKQNSYIINFGSKADNIDINKSPFKPISKLQLLALNTGESYPFADRLVEYLVGSAITPIDAIPDNIKRTQAVMSANKHYFSINGLWEEKMQKLLYDYIANSGNSKAYKVEELVSGITSIADKKIHAVKPVVVLNDDGSLRYKSSVHLSKDYLLKKLAAVEENDRKLILDERRGYHTRLGHSNKSTLFDVLGYVDRDAEKWYASWTNVDGKATVQDTIHSVDIYDGLFDI